MAMKVEQLHSGPSAIAWITVYRTCLQRDILCFGCLEVSRFLRGERGQVLVQQTGRAVAHKLRAPSHAWNCRQNFDRTGAVVCDSTRAATCALTWVL